MATETDIKMITAAVRATITDALPCEELQKLAAMADQFDRLQLYMEKTDKLSKVVFGNGEPGIAEATRENTKWIRTVNDVLMGILKTVAVMFVIGALVLLVRSGMIAP